MKVKPYPKYKDSGVEWIGEIPEEWEIHKLKNLIRSLESGKRENNNDIVADNVFSLGGEHITWNGNLNLKNKRFISNEFYNCMNNGKVFLNDTLLVKDGATIGKTAFINDMPYEKIAVNEHVFIIRSNNLIIPKLLYYMIQSDLGFKQLKLTETGSAQGGINSEFPSKVIFTLPSTFNEQIQIVNFLDEKTRNIDTIITKNEKLIGLLEEKKISLINQVVTKGLDPNVKMKYSGVEWIGEIPEDWEVKRLKYCCEYNKINLLDNTNSNFEFYYLDISNFDKLEQISSDKLLKFKNAPSRARRQVFKDNIIVSTVRTYLKAIKFLENIPDNLIVSTGFCVIEPLKRFYPKYLYYLISSEKFVQKIVSESKGVAYPAINATDLVDLNVWYPDINKQKQITNFLDKKISSIDKIISKTEKLIENLYEYKKSLIHNVVTGKIRV